MQEVLTFKRMKSRLHLGNDVVLEAESDDYQCGYLNALSTEKRQYPLRIRDAPFNPIQKRKDVQLKNDPPNNQKKGKELADHNSSKVNQPSTGTATKEKDNQHKDSATKDQIDKRDISVKEVKKVMSFNLESELAKLKVSIPFTELVKNSHYKHHLSTILFKLILCLTW